MADCDSEHCEVSFDLEVNRQKAEARTVDLTIRASGNASVKSS